MNDKVDLIENAEFGYCSLIKATENILSRLDIENITKTEITSSLRKEKRLVDSTALKEAVVNAIIHNDYSNGIPPVFEIFSDRFVITSSGGLPQELNQGIPVPVTNLYIHNVKNVLEETDEKGRNPLDTFMITVNGLTRVASNHFKTYTWSSVKGYNNLASWIDEAAELAGL